ncbi:endothelin-converting enzyme homolog isoform X1 [Anoplophora glabripennis]|uniref:endothelin-converting enzyme homolog isoform X1 n=2 Tax=Anoplophora glabripennis TaxID=217634 RepID=UPI00087441A3|nr:endothelin-converting enzyme homolog isoform X1 [Anoplophora glabripennis]XP_018573334.1 endothelin-converting enzyme homolog isoform X1 [Anoplophora glabripennis]
MNFFDNCRRDMTRYTNADFADDDSVNSVTLNERISTSATHIRYHAGSTMWKPRSPLEKALLLLVAVLLFVIFTLAAILHIAEHKLQDAKVIQVETDFSKPCLNASCVHIASNILEAMDSSFDPCEDFYSYSCNGWVKANPIPDGKSTWGTFQKLEQQNQLVIKHVLEQPMETLKSKAEQKAKMYYESCLDTNDTVETLGNKPMLDLLRRIGGWNVTDSGFNILTWTLQNITQTVQNKYNIGALFSYAVNEDDRNSSRHILQIDQSGLTLPTRENYLNKTEQHEKVLKAYLEYMTKVGVLLNGEENSTRAQMKAVIEFETKLANITTPSELRRDEESIYNLMTIAELQDRAPFIDWRKFFEDAMRIVNKKITSKEQIVVYAPEYLGNLTELIKEYNSTSEGKIVLNNYMVWQTVRVFAMCLSKDFRDAYKGLRTALMGSEGGEEPQWRYCIQDTNTVLGFAIGAIFVREVFHQDSKIQAEVMINNVRNAFKKNFSNLKWMDEETRKVAIAKADAISDMIGYPEFIKDMNQLDERFENLSVRNDTYFDNNININYFNLKKMLEKINEPVNKTTWSMAPSTVNAYYTPTKNQMVFPAGILQNPFYDPNFPPSLNYGGMGVVMGHELTHGFDDQGRQFDKYGNLNHWWKNKTIDKFKQRTKCVVDQYNKYKINGKNINGNQTLGENIADNGGLKAAYHAYLELTKSQSEPPALPGIKLSHRQLFFVAFAQVWCSAVTKEATNLQIEKDSHSPAQYRVIGALSNLKEFSQEFKCKAGSKMNPRNKCEVW